MKALLHRYLSLWRSGFTWVSCCCFDKLLFGTFWGVEFGQSKVLKLLQNQFLGLSTLFILLFLLLSPRYQNYVWASPFLSLDFQTQKPLHLHFFFTNKEQILHPRPRIIDQTQHFYSHSLCLFSASSWMFLFSPNLPQWETGSMLISSFYSSYKSLVK